MNGNPVVEISESSALNASTFVRDATAPQLVSFDAEMPSGKPPVLMTLRFSETVVLSSLNVSGIVIEDGSGHGFRLTSAMTSQNNRTAPNVVLVTVTPGDLEGIRALKTVGRDRSETFLSIDSTTIRDHAENRVTKSDGNS